MSENTRIYFGTDGVRDIANSGNMTPEFVMKLGRAYVKFLKTKIAGKISVAVGRDTRYSGPMLENALCAGMMSEGADVCSLNVIPTPGVSFVLVNGDFSGGAMISASHNPAEYNGVKFLDKDGFKLSDADEALIEGFMADDSVSERRPIGGDVGVSWLGNAQVARYGRTIASVMDKIADEGLRVSVDAANGAASPFIEQIFASWGDRVTFHAYKPDGLNINNGVGVTHMDFICEQTVKDGSDLGISYDGDTDRIQMCDSKGRILDGDIILWITAKWLGKKGSLGAGLVATVMSNMALEDLLAKDGIKVFRCGVGDRYVLETMKSSGSKLGGEQSGHIIALDYANTGDGLYSGALFLTATAELNEDISTLVDRFDKYPQILKNIKVENKKEALKSPKVAKAEAEVSALLKGKGRMLLRPSGTEPLIRIFAESRDTELMKKAVEILEKAIS